MSDTFLPTPGPWGLEYHPWPCATDHDGEPNPPVAFVGPECDDEAVALVFAPEGEDPFDSPTQRANAALIMTVPEMFAFVQRFVKWHRNINGSGLELSEMSVEAEEILAQMQRRYNATCPPGTMPLATREGG